MPIDFILSTLLYNISMSNNLSWFTIKLRVHCTVQFVLHFYYFIIINSCSNPCNDTMASRTNHCHPRTPNPIECISAAEEHPIVERELGKRCMIQGEEDDHILCSHFVHPPWRTREGLNYNYTTRYCRPYFFIYWTTLMQSDLIFNWLQASIKKYYYTERDATV